MKSNTDQIAAEAAKPFIESLRRCGLSGTENEWHTVEDSAIAVIQSAIEKAIKEHDKEQHYYAALGEAESRAAHASEQDDTKRLEYLMRFFRKLILEFGFRGGLDRQQIDAAIRESEAD